jgi:hypothetical protein
MKRILSLLGIGACLALQAAAQTQNYPEQQLLPAYAADTGAVNVLTASPAAGCPTAYTIGATFRVKPANANTTTTPTINVCGIGAKTITKFGTAALVAGDLTTTAIAVMFYDGTDMELINPQTSLAGCLTCVTSPASLPSTDLITGGGGQAVTANANDTVASGGNFTKYNNYTTVGLGLDAVEGVSDVTAQTGSQTSTNILALTPAAGHYLVKIYIDQNALCTTGTGSVYATVSWTDASHAHTAVTVPLTLANTAISSLYGYIDAALPIYSATSSAISYTTTYAACATGTGSYDLHATVLQSN